MVSTAKAGFAREIVLEYQRNEGVRQCEYRLFVSALRLAAPYLRKP